MNKIISDNELRKAQARNIIIEYSDEDIIIADNITALTGGSGQSRRTPHNIIMICTNGKLMAEINERRIVVNKDEMLIISPNTYLENVSVNSNYKCKVMCLTNKIIQDFLRPYVSVWNRSLYSSNARARKLGIEDVQIHVRFYELIRQMQHMEDNRYKTQIMQSLIKSALLAICGALEKQIEPADEKEQIGTQPERIFCSFLDILDKCQHKRQPVEYFANQLCITSKYLSVICKRQSGKTALEWIHEYVNEEIRYYLRETDIPIKEITDLLGFPNASFFGRYVKLHFGTTPKNYRNHI